MWSQLVSAPQPSTGHLVRLCLTVSPPTTPRLPPNMAASAIASASGQSIHRLLCQQYTHSMLMLDKFAQAGICLNTIGTSATVNSRRLPDRLQTFCSEMTTFRGYNQLAKLIMHVACFAPCACGTRLCHVTHLACTLASQQAFAPCRSWAAQLRLSYVPQPHFRSASSSRMPLCMMSRSL